MSQCGYSPLALSKLPIHLRKQLVDCLSRVRVHGGLDSFPAYAVELIDEYHAGSIAFSLSYKTDNKKYNTACNNHNKIYHTQ